MNIERIIDQIENYAARKSLSIKIEKVLVEGKTLLIIFTNCVDEMQEFLLPFEDVIDTILVNEKYDFNYLAI